MGKRTKITSVYLASLKPGKDNGEYVVDTGIRGQGALVMRVTASAKPLYFRYFHEGTRQFVLVGYFDPEGSQVWEKDGKCFKGGSLTLSAAREGFAELSKLQGVVSDLKAYHKREEEKAAAALRDAQLEARIGTFQQLLDAYVQHLREGGKSSADEVARIFTRDVSKPFADLVSKQARDIVPEDIQLILARIFDRGAKRQMNVVRSYLRAAFVHAGGTHDYHPGKVAPGGVAFRLRQNPVLLVPPDSGANRTGDRALSASEIKTYFRLLDRVPSDLTKAFLKVHLLIGAQRPRQLIAAPWTSYDFDQGVVTLIDGKGRGAAREHLVPLLPDAIQILKAIKNTAPGGYTHPFMNKKDTLLRLETLVKAVAVIANTEEHETPVFAARFTLRDIRRSVETRLVDLKISKEIRSQLLSHDRGGKIEKTYNRNDYLPQKRAALRAWVNFLRGKDDGKVVPIGRHQSK